MKVLKKIWNHIILLKKELLLVLSSSLFSLFAFMFTPLKPWLFRVVWGEKVEVKITMNGVNEVVLGKDIEIQTLIYPSSEVPVSSGQLEIDYSKDFFDAIGNNIFVVPEMNASHIFPSSGKLILIPKIPGKHKVVATVRTKYSIKKDSIILNVKKVLDKPTQYNWSGSWKMNLGTNQAELHLFEDISNGGRGALSGNYYFTNNSENGSVYGNFDGTTFNLYLISKNNVAKQKYLKGEYKKIEVGNDKFIEVKGKVYEVDSKKFNKTNSESNEDFIISTKIN